MDLRSAFETTTLLVWTRALTSAEKSNEAVSGELQARLERVNQLETPSPMQAIGTTHPTKDNTSILRNYFIPNTCMHLGAIAQSRQGVPCRIWFRVWGSGYRQGLLKCECKAILMGSMLMVLMLRV